MNTFLSHLLSFVYFRDHFEKLTTCDPPSNVISSDENILISWKVKSMSKKRTNKSRRFSLAKFESTSVDSTRTKGFENTFVGLINLITYFYQCS